MTIRTDDCGTCQKPIEFVRSSWQVDRGTYRNDRGHDYDWFHIGGERQCDTPKFNLAAPVPRCPKCQSTNYVHDETNPWANYDRCGDCKYEYRVSLGD